MKIYTPINQDRSIDRAMCISHLERWLLSNYAAFWQQLFTENTDRRNTIKQAFGCSHFRSRWHDMQYSTKYLRKSQWLHAAGFASSQWLQQAWLAASVKCVICSILVLTDISCFKVWLPKHQKWGRERVNQQTDIDVSRHKNIIGWELKNEAQISHAHE